jgi:hypothetical protein
MQKQRPTLPPPLPLLYVWWKQLQRSGVLLLLRAAHCACQALLIPTNTYNSLTVSSATDSVSSAQWKGAVKSGGCGGGWREQRPPTAVACIQHGGIIPQAVDKALKGGTAHALYACGAWGRGTAEHK